MAVELLKSQTVSPGGSSVRATSGRKVDRRVAKTKSALRVALVELLANKELERISVKELTDRANVTRSTFYLHYETIDDFLNEIAFEDFTDFIDSLRDQYVEQQGPSGHLRFDYLAFYTDLVTFLDASKEYHRIFSDKACGELVSKGLLHYAEVMNERDGVEIDPYTRAYLVFLVAGVSTVFTDWYMGDRSVPLEELAQISESMSAVAGSRLRIRNSESVFRQR